MTQDTATRPASQRRRPTQERSRRTVARLLDAAEKIVDEEGVAAATTRAIADRAGVAYPSLYRFFRDRDEILDQLLERHTTEVDRLSVEAEPTWHIDSPADLFDAEFALHIAYYREHPSAAKLWLGGRASEAVTAFVHQRMRTLADRLHGLLVAQGLLSPDADPRIVLIAVELGDRAIELAHRDRDDFDEELLELGRAALAAYVSAIAG